MSRLVIPTIECVESTDNFGRFLAKPLEKGFGITLGNALRRVLLNYLPGAAVTRVMIEGVHHEFTVIPHAKEDVTEFLLNVKALRLKPLADHPGKLILEIEGGGRVCAADIKPSADFEIINPELCLITLDSPKTRFYVEFDVELGEGYRPAEASDNMPVGTIPIDAIFTPIRKVNFTIEPTHIGQEISREQLFIEVSTDGTISPVDAISCGAGLLIEQLTPFMEYVKVSQMEAEERLIRLSIPEEKYNMPMEQLDLSVRTMNCLRRSGISTVGELVSKRPEDLFRLRNFGQKSFQEIEERLKEMGLSLAPPADSKKEEEEAPHETESPDMDLAETTTDTGSLTKSEEQSGEVT